MFLTFLNKILRLVRKILALSIEKCLVFQNLKF